MLGDVELRWVSQNEIDYAHSISLSVYSFICLSTVSRFITNVKHSSCFPEKPIVFFFFFKYYPLFAWVSICVCVCVVVVVVFSLDLCGKIRYFSIDKWMFVMMDSISIFSVHIFSIDFREHLQRQYLMQKKPSSFSLLLWFDCNWEAVNSWTKNLTKLYLKQIFFL